MKKIEIEHFMAELKALNNELLGGLRLEVQAINGQAKEGNLTADGKVKELAKVFRDDMEELSNRIYERYVIECAKLEITQIPAPLTIEISIEDVYGLSLGLSESINMEDDLYLETLATFLVTALDIPRQVLILIFSYTLLIANGDLSQGSKKVDEMIAQYDKLNDESLEKMLLKVKSTPHKYGVGDVLTSCITESMKELIKESDIYDRLDTAEISEYIAETTKVMVASQYRGVQEVIEFTEIAAVSLFKALGIPRIHLEYAFDKYIAEVMETE